MHVLGLVCVCGCVCVSVGWLWPPSTVFGLTCWTGASDYRVIWLCSFSPAQDLALTRLLAHFLDSGGLHQAASA